MPERLVFIEQFYYPEGWGGAALPRDLTMFLASSGFAVEVICGSDQYVSLQDDDSIDPASVGVNIRRVPPIIAGGARRLRLARQIWFYIALAPLLLLRRRPQLFVTQTNPPLAVFLVAAAARLWRRPLIIIAMDIYPEVAEAYGIVNSTSVLGRLLRGLFRWSYRVAHRVVALGPVMRQRLVAKGVDADRVLEISNWSTGSTGVVRGEHNGLRSDWDLEGKFVLVYSGNLGIGHEFDTLLRGLAVALRSAPDIGLVFIGTGSRLSEVRRLVQELQLADSVRFEDFLPGDRLPESLGLADIALVTLRPGFQGLIVPSKLLSYMARGIPVMYIGPPSDVDAYLGNGSRGTLIRNDDIDGVARAIIDLRTDPVRLAALGDAGKRYYDGELAREHGLARYESLVRGCIAGD